MDPTTRVIPFNAAHNRSSVLAFSERVIGQSREKREWKKANATAMRAAGSDANHIPFHRVYPDDSIATTFDRVSATEYTLHATVRSGGKTIRSVDTCLRAR